MGQADTRMETVENIIKSHFGCCPDGIRKIENETNNSVYPFTVAGEQCFLKLYRSKDWPEEGKIPFVYRSLSQKGTVGRRPRERHNAHGKAYRTLRGLPIGSCLQGCPYPSLQR